MQGLLAAPWLRLCVSSARAAVGSLVGELRSAVPCCAAKELKKKK